MTEDLTEIDGVGDAIAEQLREAGFETVSSVEGATVDELADVHLIGEASAKSILDGEGGTGGRRAELEQHGEIVDLVAGELQNGATVPEACAEAGISTSAYHNWRRKGEQRQSDGADDDDVFVEFLEETTRARRIGAKRDRERLKDLIADEGDTRTWYKLHHDQYGDSYDGEGGDGDAAEGIPLVVPDAARPDS
jgi:hypothetical protein